jgi:hypothetical protein
VCFRRVNGLHDGRLAVAHPREVPDAPFVKRSSGIGAGVEEWNECPSHGHGPPC